MAHRFTPQFYERFYMNPRTRVTTRAEMERRAEAVGAIVKQLEIKVARIRRRRLRSRLDACGAARGVSARQVPSVSR